MELVSLFLSVSNYGFCSGYLHHGDLSKRIISETESIQSRQENEYLLDWKDGHRCFQQAMLNINRSIVLKSNIYNYSTKIRLARGTAIQCKT